MHPTGAGQSGDLLPSGMIIVGFAIYDLKVLTTRKDKSGGMS
jgi:hypothetical protein